MQELNSVCVVIKQKQNCTNWQQMYTIIIKKEGDMCRTKVQNPSNYTIVGKCVVASSSARDCYSGIYTLPSTLFLLKQSLKTHLGTRIALVLQENAVGCNII